MALKPLQQNNILWHKSITQQKQTYLNFEQICQRKNRGLRRLKSKLAGQVTDVAAQQKFHRDLKSTRPWYMYIEGKLCIRKQFP